MNRRNLFSMLIAAPLGLAVAKEPVTHFTATWVDVDGKTILHRIPIKFDYSQMVLDFTTKAGRNVERL